MPKRPNPPSFTGATAQQVNAAQAELASAAQVEKARAALESPYLIPGDAEVLRLRIMVPRKPMAQLAEIAGMTKTAFAAKFRGACNRKPTSRLARGMPMQERRSVLPVEAAAVIGVTPADLRHWEKRGTLVVTRSPSGKARWVSGAEVVRVRGMFAETVFEIVRQLDAGGRPS